jgi:hypothetical protein
VDHGNNNFRVTDTLNDGSAQGVSFSGDVCYIHARNGMIYIRRTTENALTYKN